MVVKSPKPHPLAIPKQPQGQATRGKTARNRLRRVDNFFTIYDPTLFRRRDGAFVNAFYVDLGFGAEPFTTLESAIRLRRLNPNLRVLGVEIDSERVAAALPYADKKTHFRLGGFNLPLQHQGANQPETVRAIRAFNVLRQYDEDAVQGAYHQLARHVLPGGLLMEGTSDPLGQLWVANLMRRTPRAATDTLWSVEGLVFSTNFRTEFDPALFQAVLPKNYIHNVVSGEWIYDFFEDWKAARLATSSLQVWGQRQWFCAAARQLAERGYLIDTRQKWLNRGYLILRPLFLNG